MHCLKERLLIVGASARAAADSAHRAGFEPLAVDCFGDQDLRAICPTQRITNYPTEFVGVAAAAPHADWLYTGGLENYPEVVDEISKSRLLLGNCGEILRRVRDPEKWSAALLAEGLRTPRLSIQSSLPPDVTWLRKPFRSCAGIGIRHWKPNEIPNLLVDGGHDRSRFFYQEFIDGLPCSGLFVAAKGDAVFLGASQQLVGCEWLGAKDYWYCGSIGPLELPSQVCDQFQRIGKCLAQRFDLRGLFGADVILRDREVWTIEVNPRFTASVEVLERAMGWNATQLHAAACRHGLLPTPLINPPAQQCIGKAILFATQSFSIETEFEKRIDERNSRTSWPVIVDVPSTGSKIESGQPVFSVRCTGISEANVAKLLRENVERIHQDFQFSFDPSWQN